MSFLAFQKFPAWSRAILNTKLGANLTSPYLSFPDDSFGFIMWPTDIVFTKHDMFFAIIFYLLD